MQRFTRGPREQRVDKVDEVALMGKKRVQAPSSPIGSPVPSTHTRPETRIRTPKQDSRASPSTEHRQRSPAKKKASTEGSTGASAGGAGTAAGAGSGAGAGAGAGSGASAAALVTKSNQVKASSRKQTPFQQDLAAVRKKLASMKANNEPLTPQRKGVAWELAIALGSVTGVIMGTLTSTVGLRPTVCDVS